MSDGSDDDLPAQPDDAERIPLGDVEQVLSERRIDSDVGQAEVIDVVSRRLPDDRVPDAALVVTFQTVSGMEATECLPLPQRGEDYRDNDIAALLQFTGVDANDLAQLEAQRVPFRGGSVDWTLMRNVLDIEARDAHDWTLEERLEEATRLA